MARQEKLFDVIAISDYRPEDYPAIYALAPNGGGMEKTFDEWKKLADAVAVQAAMRGQRVVRVLIKPDEFIAWLARHDLKSTPETRARFGLEIANRKHGSH